MGYDSKKAKTTRAGLTMTPASCLTDTQNTPSATHVPFVPPEVQAELIAGLNAPQACISPKFLYDPLGCKLFEAICELPEYYPTRTEAAIVSRHGAELARACGEGVTLIDLGAGNCAKAATLFPLLKPAHYVAIDISRDFVCDAVDRLQQRFPDIAMRALGLDFSSSLDLPDSVAREKRLFFYPGSSIGNFTPDEARAFLQRIRAQCDDDGALLIGIDLVKDRAVLDAAYDDALGVTAAFNLNMLRHVNGLIGADFDISQWRHVGFFNPGQSRIEMHLEAREALTVRWQGGQRGFDAGQRIHTENSYKYRQSSAVGLLEQSGLRAAQVWLDPNEWFALIYARPIAEPHPGAPDNC
jgi:dimethylhistidine N-methyltransferase